MSPLGMLLWLMALVVSQGKLVLQHYDDEKERVVNLNELLQNLSDSLNIFRKDLADIRDDVTAKLARFERKIKENCDLQTNPVSRNCADVYAHSSQRNGVYLVHPINSPPFVVYCDMTTDGGGWTVLQKRGTSHINITGFDFDRNWQEYKDGFGSFDTDFWIGTEKLYLMTRYGEFELRVELRDLQQRRGFAEYSTFQVRSEREYYSLRIGGYYGNIGDSMSQQNGMLFSTADRDNDLEPKYHCARVSGGAWWYNRCQEANLNGVKTEQPSETNRIVWPTWKGEPHTITKTEMRFRPRGWKP